MPASRFAGLILLVLLVGALPARRPLAQGQAEAGDPGPDPQPEMPSPQQEVAPPPGIEAIEVTGERLNDANVQDEAQAITAFTGADLDRASIVNVDTLQFNVPGLHVGQSANAPIITLRGIGTENSSLTGEPGVAFHIDGISFGRPSAARVAFFDLETLDVKRGPQGLLGGKNSTSGSINLITRKPGDEYEVTGDALFGNYDRVRLRGAVNVPLGEYLATRLAFYREDRDGFLDNVSVSDSKDPFDADDFGLRGHMKVSPSDRFQMLFSYNYYKQDGVGPQSDPVGERRTVECAPIQAPTLDRTTGLVLRSPTVPTRTTVSHHSAACYSYLGVAEPVFVPPSRFPQIRYRDPFTGRFIEAMEVIPGTDPPQTRTVYPQGVFWPATEDGDPRKVYLDPERRDLGLTYSQRNRFWGWTVGGEWDAPALPLLGETQLKLVGGFQKLHQTFGQDFDGTDRPLSGYRLDPDTADQYNGSMQWSGAAWAERLEWQASLFYMHEQALRNVRAPGLVPGQQNTVGIFSEQTTNNHSYGAGLHGTLALNDALSWSLGGRWVRDDRHTLLLRQNLAETSFGAEQMFRSCHGALLTRAGQGNEPANVPIKPNRSCEDTYRGVMWGTGLEWRPFGDNHLLYARLDRGFKGGGFRAGTVGKYKPEKIWAYAVGTKSEFLDQTLRLNVEGFFYAYTDLQLVILDGFALRTENTDARMWGADLEAFYSPIDGLNLSAVISHLKTETIDYFSLDPANVFDNPVERSIHDSRLGARELAESRQAEGEETSGQSNFALLECSAGVGGTTVPCGFYGDKDGLDDFSGNNLSRSPKWKLTLSGEYEIPLGRFGSLTPRVQYTWQDDTYFRAFNRDFDLQEAYHLTNLKLLWTSPEQMWSVEAFVENVEDEAAKQNILVGPRGFGSPPFAWYNPPRFYGIQIGFKY